VTVNDQKTDYLKAAHAELDRLTAIAHADIDLLVSRAVAGRDTGNVHIEVEVHLRDGVSGAVKSLGGKVTK
jgi:uncharacterized protein YfaQ (DUF2300 family)